MRHLFLVFVLVVASFLIFSECFALSPESAQWSYRGKDQFVLTKAEYKGKLENRAVRWTSEFSLETLVDDDVRIPFLPQSVTLSDLKIDGKSSLVMAEGGSFVALLRGVGVHHLSAEFVTNVSEDGQSPHVLLPIHAVPVSHLELSLPGKKEMFLQPTTDIRYKVTNEGTVASAFLPMTTQIDIRWSEGVPDEKAEFHASTMNYHFLSASEGILALRAVIEFEVSRGETNSTEIEVPKGIEIVKVQGPEVSDWRLIRSGTDSNDKIQIFFSKPMRSNFSLEVLGERALPKKGAEENIISPVLRIQGVQRQRGIIALLNSKEYALKPTEETDLVRVGENVLPANVREGVSMVVAHTFKYGDTQPRLVVQTTTPEKQAGKFDANVYSLYSVHDLSLIGASTIELNVKSGSIEELEFSLPAKVNLLSLTAPSLRSHKESVEGTQQIVRVEFTQAMEGQLAIETRYEQLLSDADLTIPRIQVSGTEVEAGQLAVEALSAVELKASSVAGLSLLEQAQLSQQILLKTSNPILMAYGYTKTDTPYSLDLKLTRHSQIEVQAASIDWARYRTLVIPEGLMITTADFQVRNKNNQFLRVRLPEGAKVWSVTVDGVSERPAMADKPEGDTSTEILVRIKNAVQGFPVKITYEAPAPQLGSFGTIKAKLPRPDIPVVDAQWDVFLPNTFTYSTLSTNMDLLSQITEVNRDILRSEMGKVSLENGSEVQLSFPIPESGARLSFKKLYYNRAEDDAYISVKFTSGISSIISVVFSFLGTMAMLFGLYSMLSRDSAPRSKRLALYATCAGGSILIFFYYVIRMSTYGVYAALIGFTIYLISRILKMGSIKGIGLNSKLMGSSEVIS